MKRSAKHLLSFLIALLSAGPSYAQDSTQIVIAWLKQNCIPLKSIEPVNDFSDLKPLEKVLKDVQVIGLGEGTHGTSEFVKIRHRLIEYLVTKMGFTALALESSYSNCEPINEYILSGKGDLSELLTGQGYSPWDVEEFAFILIWLRDHNKMVSDEKKVRFYGLDIPTTFQEVGRERVMAYLKVFAIEKVDSTEIIFRVLANKKNSWPSRLDQTALEQIFMPLHELIGYFSANKEKLVKASSSEKWEQTIRYLEVMEQGLFVNVKNIPYSLSSEKLSRDDYMAQNLFYLMQNERPNTKFMIWAHNVHIANDTEKKMLGYHLRQRLGEKYYALGFECNEGIFNSRVLLPDGYWGEFKMDSILPVQKSVAWYLKQTGNRNLFIDLRQATTNPVVDQWQDTPIRIVDGFWVYRNSTDNFLFKKIKGLYDGIVYTELSTPTHPTKNALALSAARIGF